MTIKNWIIQYRVKRRSNKQLKMSNWVTHWLRRKLSLNEHQASKLQALSVDAMTAYKETRQQRAKGNELVDKLLATQQFDHEQALQIMTLYQQPFGQYANSLVDAFGEFYASLDNFQKEKMLVMWRRHSYHHC